jgi:hypothetical protein
MERMTKRTPYAVDVTGGRDSAIMRRSRRRKFSEWRYRPSEKRHSDPSLFGSDAANIQGFGRAKFGFSAAFFPAILAACSREI